MNKLLDRSLKKLLIYAGIVLAFSIPVYYITISLLLRYEFDEHNIIPSAEDGREDRYLIILAVTVLTVLFFALMLAGFILLNRRISNRLWQPFYRSLEQIKKFDLGRQEKIMFGETDIEEFSELNHGLDRLIDGSIAAYAQQKEFADNASHELQTPLAIVQSKLDLLLQNKSLTTEQYNIIEDANRALARVTRINKNLLLLTKIENSQFMDRERIDLSALLDNNASLFATLAEGRGLSLETNIRHGVEVEGNRILVEILLNNLVTNAIRYSPEGGKIVLSLAPDSLTVRNPGEVGLKEEQLFRRFSTASSQSPGTGLGLALVKQICGRYGWQVVYRFGNAAHIFSIRFSA
ncbi:sensor histidine kinase [Chitinophaga sp. GCM10012297]|uniref:histidine kinase n=1 Tax=Chitinophaga chungangae TaxID=2821488 RepID=A0ABS3Y9D4_9BACT|nr:HAMP domain-containing sensor histidine kinase [Chitinophaga chungangae]MBO9151292.1 HAMP domain-containing histidine kinase [Chitinophaga chungangae]